MRDWIISTLGGGATALAIVIAVIGLAGALGGAAASYLVAQQTVYVTAITAERMKWVNALRENIAKLATAMDMILMQARLGDEGSMDSVIQSLSNCHNLISTMTLQLNPKSEVDLNIIKILSVISNSIHPDHHEHVRRLNSTLIRHAQWLLKMEWERIKYEARGWIGRLWHVRDQGRLISGYREFMQKNEGMDLIDRLLTT